MVSFRGRFANGLRNLADRLDPDKYLYCDLDGEVPWGDITLCSSFSSETLIVMSDDSDE